MDKRLKYLLPILLLIFGCSGVDDLKQKIEALEATIEALETRVITLEKESYLHCTAIDHTPGVTLWGECYSIENTYRININRRYGSSDPRIENGIPPWIGRLTNLKELSLRNHGLRGEIPQAVCDMFKEHPPPHSAGYALGGNNFDNYCE